MKLTSFICVAALALMTACAAPNEAERTETLERTLTVREIDRDNRTFAVTGEGQRFNLRVSEAVKNFEQIEVGDKLKVEYFESVAVSMAEPTDSGDTFALDGVEVAPEGAKPGIAGAKVVSTVVEFVSYDPSSNVALVKLMDGSLFATTVKRELRSYAKARVPGERIAVDVTSAFAVGIEPAS